MRDVQWSDSVLRVRAFGPIAKDSMVEAARCMTSDQRYDKLQFVVADFLDAEGSDATLLQALEDMLALLLGAASSNPNVRIAIVAQDPYIMQLAEALVRFSTDTMVQIRAFTDRAAAATWVGAQPRLSRPSLRFRPR